MYPLPETQPEPLPRTPIRPGEFIGHRVWLVCGADDLPGDRVWLNSFVMRYAWQPGVPVRDISYDPKNRIQEQNMVGIWSFKDRDGLLNDFLSGWEGIEYPIVIGTAWLWGTIIEHEKGYRAQYAAIRSLDTIYWGWGGEDNSDAVLEKLRAIYLRKRK